MKAYLLVTYVKDRNNIDPYGFEVFATDSEAIYNTQHLDEPDEIEYRLYLITEDFDEGGKITLLRSKEFGEKEVIW